MIISSKQLKVLDNLHEILQRARVVARILAEFPEVANRYSPDTLDGIVKTCFKAGAGLGIEHEEHVYRLCRLNFIDPTLINRPYVQKVLYLVLNNTAASPAARLEFIERQILSRQSEIMRSF